MSFVYSSQRRAPPLPFRLRPRSSPALPRYKIPTSALSLRFANFSPCHYYVVLSFFFRFSTRAVFFPRQAHNEFIFSPLARPCLDMRGPKFLELAGDSLAALPLVRIKLSRSDLQKALTLFFLLPFAIDALLFFRSRPFFRDKVAFFWEGDPPSDLLFSVDSAPPLMILVLMGLLFLPPFV